MLQSKISVKSITLVQYINVSLYAVTVKADITRLSSFNSNSNLVPLPGATPPVNTALNMKSRNFI